MRMEKIGIKIKSQTNDIHICKHVILNIKSAKDYDRPYWLCSEDDYILGCYKSIERANEIMDEIFIAGDTYIMPKE